MTFNSDEQFRQFITLDGFLLGGPLRNIEHMWFSVVGIIRMFTPCRLLLDRFVWVADARLENGSLRNTMRPKDRNTLRDL